MVLSDAGWVLRKECKSQNLLKHTRLCPTLHFQIIGGKTDSGRKLLESSSGITRVDFMGMSSGKFNKLMVKMPQLNSWL